jgi:hypothetical protein
MRYELTDNEWSAIKPMLPNKPRGVPRVNDRRVLNGIFWVLRSGAPWRDLPDNFGPYTTCYNRFVRWRRAGVWAKLMSALPDRLPGLGGGCSHDRAGNNPLRRSDLVFVGILHGARLGTGNVDRGSIDWNAVASQGIANTASAARIERPSCARAASFGGFESTEAQRT